MIPQNCCDEINACVPIIEEIRDCGETFCPAFVSIHNQLTRFVEEILDVCVSMYKDFGAVGQNAEQFTKSIKATVENQKAENTASVKVDIETVGKNLREPIDMA